MCNHGKPCPFDIDYSKFGGYVLNICALLRYCTNVLDYRYNTVTHPPFFHADGGMG